ncbi:MAG: hypothetical protein QNJ16_07350 [Rhodobacter sp.]|nr:hypothetical protein [Rhodobacter sp.]
MIDRDRFTKPTRKTTVCSIRIEKTQPGDSFHPSEMARDLYGLSGNDIDGPVWHVWISTKTGLDQNNLGVFRFTNEEEAQEVAKEFQVGSEVPDHAENDPLLFREIYQKAGNLKFFSTAGDNDFFECYDCLQGAGVIDSDAQPTRAVLDWCGEETVERAKSEWGENWSAYCEFAYCLNHFPRSSLAHISSQIMYAYFIEYDDFSAGYLLRELQFLMGGAEEIASQTIETRSKAGKAGSHASRKARGRRIEAFMQAIEALSDLSPRMNERAILDQAFKNAVASDPALWRQGKGRKEEYETELRLNHDYRTRYFSVFGKTA